MISLLEILNRERSIIDGIRRRESHIRSYEKQMDSIKQIDIDCKCKYDDLKKYQRLIDEERAFIVLANLELTEARDQLRDYLKELFEPLNSKET